MTTHEWTAIFTIPLTDSEAAQAYTFDLHGKKVLASKMTDENGFVDVGCIKCEEVYVDCHDKECSAPKENK